MGAEKAGSRSSRAAAPARSLRGILHTPTAHHRPGPELEGPQHQEWPFHAEADTTGRVRYAEMATWADLPDTHCAELTFKLRWVMHPRFALHVAEFFPDLYFEGTVMHQGRYVRVLVPAGQRPEYHSLYFDEATGLLSHIGYHNDLLEWRAVDGVMRPHRWVFGRKGGHTTYLFEEVAASPAPLGP